jgi:hypothetical protein
MIIHCCGMAVKRMGMLGVCVRMEVLTVKLETVTMNDKGRKNLTYFAH